MPATHLAAAWIRENGLAAALPEHAENHGGPADRPGTATGRSGQTRPRRGVVRWRTIQHVWRLHSAPTRVTRTLYEPMTESNAITADTIMIRGGEEIRWRTQRMVSLGADAELAATIAASHADVHDIERLLEAGCPLDVAWTITRPGERAAGSPSRTGSNRYLPATSTDRYDADELGPEHNLALAHVDRSYRRKWQHHRRRRRNLPAHTKISSGRVTCCS